jgi:REP element-mobilizing transposase RayT
MGMPRQARIDAPGALHHLIVRGIERKNIFKDDIDRNGFIERLLTILPETSTSCFAWSLMHNHVHLLCRTGKAPIATVMRRLLTGYAISYNHRHKRHGQLFQNRYKSILCQEDSYLLELTRYIHLNPLRAGAVQDIKTLSKYAYTGHAAILGKTIRSWQDTDYILRLFSMKKKVAQRKYLDFVFKGISQGRRPELTGGGLIRSVGGWKAAKALKKGMDRLKGDERILGDSNFVQSVLQASQEKLDRKYQLQEEGYTLKTLSEKVAHLFHLEPSQLFSPTKSPKIVKARSLMCYFAVRELGLTATGLAKKIGLKQPAISISVGRGEKIAKEMSITLRGK